MWPDFTCAKRVSERREGEKKPSSEEFFYELKNRTRERKPVSLFTRPFHAALAREESWSVRVKNREERNKDRASVNDSLTLRWSLRENVYEGRQTCVTHETRSWKYAWNFAIWSSYETGKKYSQIPPKKNEQNLRNVSQNRFSNINEIFQHNISPLLSVKLRKNPIISLSNRQHNITPRRLSFRQFLRCFTMWAGIQQHFFVFPNNFSGWIRSRRFEPSYSIVGRRSRTFRRTFGISFIQIVRSFIRCWWIRTVSVTSLTMSSLRVLAQHDQISE